jgi:hypothetical protein
MPLGQTRISGPRATHRQAMAPSTHRDRFGPNGEAGDERTRSLAEAEVPGRRKADGRCDHRQHGAGMAYPVRVESARGPGGDPIRFGQVDTRPQTIDPGASVLFCVHAGHQYILLPGAADAVTPKRCSVFTSNYNFHAQIVPLFLGPEQTFVNGIALKEDLAKLVAHYESLPLDVLKTGLIHFAVHPPEDPSAFLTTRLWDKHLPRWREIKAAPKPPLDPAEEKGLVEETNQKTDSPDLRPHDEEDIDKLDYATVRRMVRPKKGRWLRFSEAQIERMMEDEKRKARGADGA